MNWGQPESFLNPRGYRLQERKIRSAVRLSQEKAGEFKEVDNQLDLCLRLPSIAASYDIDSVLTENS
jgi:hypothetical protein